MLCNLSSQSRILLRTNEYESKMLHFELYLNVLKEQLITYVAKMRFLCSFSPLLDNHLIWKFHFCFIVSLTKNCY